MDMLIRAAAVGCIGAAAALVIKKDNPSAGLMLGIVVAGCIFSFSLDTVSEIFDLTQKAAQMSGMSAAIFTPLLKIVGIGILARIAADICKDAGQASSASAIEIAGCVCALRAALPLMSTALELISSLL